MSAAEIIYVGGMAAITLGFPTVLVVMMALGQIHAARLTPVLAAQTKGKPEAEAHPPALRRAA
jgi:hypothetical protein